MPDESHHFAANPGDWLSARLVSVCEGAEADLRLLAGTPSAGIHALRVRMKELRALLRLTRGALPASDRKRLGRRMRDIKNAFASNRDAEVMAAAAARMGPLHHLPPPVLAPDDPAPTDAAPSSAPGVRLPAVRRKLSALRRDLAALPLQNLTHADIVASYARCQRACRRALKRCARDPAPERLHLWRKRVKDWSYLSQALRFLPHARLGVRPARKLGSDLGDIQDLALLHRHLSGPSASEWLRALASTIQRQTRRTLARAIGQLLLSHRKLRRHLRKETRDLLKRCPDPPRTDNPDPARGQERPTLRPVPHPAAPEDFSGTVDG